MLSATEPWRLVSICCCANERGPVGGSACLPHGLEASPLGLDGMEAACSSSASASKCEVCPVGDLNEFSIEASQPYRPPHLMEESEMEIDAAQEKSLQTSFISDGPNAIKDEGTFMILPQPADKIDEGVGPPPPPNGELTAVQLSEGFLVKIDKRDNDRQIGAELGIVHEIGLGSWTGGALKIKRVKRKGLIWQWNMANPNMQVNALDLIVRVNGRGGISDELLNEMSKEPVLQLHILRPSEFAAI